MTSNKTEFKKLEKSNTTVRIVIPKEYRDKLELNPGDYMKVRIQGRKIIMEKIE